MRAERQRGSKTARQRDRKINCERDEETKTKLKYVGTLFTKITLEIYSPLNQHWILDFVCPIA